MFPGPCEGKTDRDPAVLGVARGEGERQGLPVRGASHEERAHYPRTGPQLERKRGGGEKILKLMTTTPYTQSSSFVFNWSFGLSPPLCIREWGVRS